MAPRLSRGTNEHKREIARAFQGKAYRPLDESRILERSVPFVVLKSGAFSVVSQRSQSLCADRILPAIVHVVPFLKDACCRNRRSIKVNSRLPRMRDLGREKTKTKLMCAYTYVPDNADRTISKHGAPFVRVQAFRGGFPEQPGGQKEGTSRSV